MKVCSIAFAGGLSVLLTTLPALAQKIDPQCAKMRDKVGCTCAIQNGGQVVAEPGGGYRWFYPGRSIDAFAQCMRRAGRK